MSTSFSLSLVMLDALQVLRALQGEDESIVEEIQTVATEISTITIDTLTAAADSGDWLVSLKTALSSTANGDSIYSALSDDEESTSTDCYEAMPKDHHGCCHHQLTIEGG